MTYRNDEDAVEARRIEIERELADVKERSNELACLTSKRNDLENELAELKKRKASYAQKRLPMLAQARIASPCSASWEKMTGNDQVRFCGSCQKNVYDLSAMTSGDAEALLREKEGDLCARFYRRADGTIMTSDCSVGVRKKRVQRIAGAALFFGGAAAAFSSYEKSHKASDETPIVMGAMMAVPNSSAPPAVDPFDSPEKARTTTTPPNSPAQTDRVHVMGGLRAMPRPPQKTEGARLKKR